MDDTVYAYTAGKVPTKDNGGLAAHDAVGYNIGREGYIEAASTDSTIFALVSYLHTLLLHVHEGRELNR